MGALGIPGVINNFNLYNNGTALVGLTGEISLPDFEGMTETLSGPGILGEIEEVIIGQFGSMELEIPFRILDEDAFKLMSPATSLNLTLRASEQFTVKSTGGIDYKGMRVVVRTYNYSHSLIVNTACALDCELLTGSECQIQRSCRGHEFECVLIEDAERNLQFHASELSDDYFLDFSKDTGTAQCLGHSLEVRQGDFPCQTHECCSVVVKVEVINNSGNT